MCETQRRRVWLGEQVIYELIRPLARPAASPDVPDVSGVTGVPDVPDVGDATVVRDVTVVDVSLGAVSFRVEERSQARYGAFWATFAAGTFEPATVSVLEAELGPGLRFLDIGAWIGPFTLLAAALDAQVTAFEPDPVAVAALRNNLALNPALAERVEVRPVAVAASAGPVRLDGGTLGLGNGLSRVRLGRPASWRKGWRQGWPARLLGSARTAPAGADIGGDTGADVEAVAVAALDLEGYHVIKIDIEGGEFDLVPRLGSRLASNRSVLLLSLHGPDPAGLARSAALALRLAGAPRRLRLLWALRGYCELRQIANHRRADTTVLNRAGQLALAFRLGETELICRAGPAGGSGPKG